MNNKSQVVIVSVSVGYGHQKVAENIKKALEEFQPAIPVCIVDLLEESRTLQKVKKLYLTMLEKTPSLYGNAYSWSRKAGPTGSLLSWLCNRGLERIRQKYHPAAFILLHPFATGAYLPIVSVPAFAVITDFAFHASWFNPRIRGYFVARESVADSLAKRGFPRERIHCTGIPISPAFDSNFGAESGAFTALAGPSTGKLYTAGCRSRTPFILVMGGGLGLGAVQETVEILDELAISLEGVVLAGQNRGLQESLETRLVGSSNNWQVFSFIDGVEHLTRRADLLITKGGAVTLSEAVACKLPVIIYRPLPGQEEENAGLAVREGWACRAEGKESLRENIRALLLNPYKMETMSRQACARGMPSAARDVARIMADELKTMIWRQTS